MNSQFNDIENNEWIHKVRKLNTNGVQRNETGIPKRRSFFTILVIINERNNHGATWRNL